MANSTRPEPSARSPSSVARVTMSAAATAVLVDALLFAGTLSVVVVETVAVAVMIVPVAVPGFTRTTMAKSATAPFARTGWCR